MTLILDVVNALGGVNQVAKAHVVTHVMTPAKLRLLVMEVV